MYLKSATVVLLLVAAVAAAAKECHTKKTSSKLFCYYGKAKDVNSCKCSHVILPASSDVKSIEGVREKLAGAKILLTVNEFNEGLVNTLKKTKLDGLEIDLKKLDSKSDISDFVATVRSKLGSDLYLAIAVPPKAETLAKYFDFKVLSKSADVFIVQTHFLGASKNVTFHPSRLSGLWDVQNTDSVVDLISGLGAPLSKLVISAPVQGFRFTLQDEKHTAPGSPAVELSTMTRDQLCEKMSSDKWMLERDQDQAGPYIFRDKEWVSFEDSTSMDIKAKYSRIRGLAGLALKDLSQDGGVKCGDSLLEAAFAGLSRQARAPRGAVLHSLEREILQAPAKLLDNVQVSPYRISRVIDVEGKVHVIRQDTRTEFECSRQGYFVHPRSCGRFYRCVKFDQLSDEFSVFEFDCPAGLAFDNRVEVCVWPGSLPHASACSGSSEIAPVPKDRFVCPGEPGYFADPENCRWFFACLDHGKSPLSAYEFRCPYGLVFDQERLLCEWSWLVPKCGSGSAGYIHGEEYHFGHGTRSGGYALEEYNGLGVLNNIPLGGLQGPLVQPVQKTYSSFSNANDNFANAFGLQKSSSAIGPGSVHFATLGGGVDGAFANSGSGRGSGRYHSGAGSFSSANGGSGSYNAGQESSSSGSSGYNAGSGSYTAGQESSSSGSSGYNAGSGSLLGGDGSYNVEDGSYNVGDGRYKGEGSYRAGSSSSGSSGSYNAGGLTYNSGAGSSSSGQVSYSGGIGGYNSAEGNSGVKSTYSAGDGSYSIGFENTGTNGAGIESYGSEGRYNSGEGSSTAGQGSYSTTGLKIGDGSYSIGHGSHNNGAYISGQDGHTILTGGSAGSGGNTASSGSYSTGISHSSGGNLHATHGSDILIGTGSYSADSGHSGSGSYAHDNSGSYVAGGNGASHSYSHIQHGTSNSGASSQSGISELNHGSHTTKGSNFNLGQSGSFGDHLGVVNLGSNFESQKVGGYSNGFRYGSQSTGQLDINQGAAFNGYGSVSSSNLGGSSHSFHNNGGQSIGNQFIADQGIYAGGYSSGHHTSGEGNTYSFSNVHTDHHNHATQVHSAGEVHHTLGHVNIVAGGSSGVAKEGIELIQHGVNLGSVEHVTPISVVSSSIPSVTSVPIPTGKAYEFEFYNGGVVANLPDLQYKLEHPSTINAYLSGYNSYKDIKAKGLGFQNYTQFVSSTQAPLILKSDVITSGFDVVKATSGPVKTITNYHTTGNNGGYVYNTPTIKFEEKSNAYIPPAVSTYLPPAPSTYLPPAPTTYLPPTPKPTHVVYLPPVPTPTIYLPPAPKVTPAVYLPPSKATSSVSFTQHTAHRSYVQPLKPAGGFKVGVVESHSFHKPSGGYQYSKPVVAFEENPLKIQPVVQVQPAVTYQEIKHHVQPTVVIQKEEGYHYDKPTVTFEEKPQVIVQHTPAVAYQEIKHNIQPLVIQQEVKPAVTYHEVKQEGHHYEKPRVAFEEKPQVIVQHTPAVAYQEIKHNVQPLVIQQEVKPAVTYHEVKQEGYHYEKPAVAFEEKVQPAVTYQEIKHTVQPAISYHRDEKVHKHEGYHYQKPAIVFEEKPAIVQPAVTYQEIQHDIQPVVSYHHDVKIHKDEGYHYEKPAIAFEERPVQKVYVQPAVNYQQIKHEHHIQPTVQVKVEKHEGYHYVKPAIPFEEKPVIIENTHIQPAVTYQEIKHDIRPTVGVTLEKHEGYHYEQPAVVFEEKKVQHVQPAVTYQEISFENKGYRYEKPVVAFEEKPVVHVQQPIQQVYHKPTIVEHKIQPVTYQEVKVEQPVVGYQEVKHEGYHYEKPAVAFVDKPVVHTQTYQKPVVHQSTAYQEVKHEGYHYEKPAIKFEEKPIVHVQQPIQEVVHVQQPIVEHQGYQYVKPTVAFEEKPVVHVQHKYVKPAVTYQEFNVRKEEGYHYQKPVVKFEEKPVVHTVQHQPVTYQEIKIENQQGYHYEQPSVAFEEKRVVQPQVTYHEVKQPIIFEQRPTYKDVLTETVKPAIISSFSIQQPQQKIIHEYNYEKKVEVQPVSTYLPVPTQTYLPAPEPTLTYLPAPEPTLTYLPAPKPTVAYLPVKTPTQRYLPVKKPVQAYLPVEQKTVVEEYYPVRHQQTVNVDYSSQEEVSEEPIVAKKISLSYQGGYEYPKPVVKFEDRPILSTPKPTFASTVASIVQPVKEYKFASYDSRLNQSYKKQEDVKYVVSSTPAYLEYEEHSVVAPVKQSRPIVRYEFSSLDDKYNQGYQGYQNDVVVSSTFAPLEEVHVIPEREYLLVKPVTTYLPVTTRRPRTRRPIVTSPISTYLPVTTPKRVYVPVRTTTEKYVEVTSPRREYLPVRTTTEKYVEVTSPSREYLPVTQEIYKIKAPKRVYLPVTTTEKYVEVTKSSREYLPVTQETYKIKSPKRVYVPVTITQKPSREYLPSKEYLPVVSEEPSLEYLPVTSEKPNLEYLPVKGSKQVENYQISDSYVSTRRPKIVKIVRAKSKPIVKVNDFHPILSAKLGAQCTCVSNTLTLRKKPKALAIETVVDGEESYVIDDYPSDGGEIIVEDFKYEPQKLEDYTYDQSVDDYAISTRRPAVSKAVEVFVKKSRRPVTVVREKTVIKEKPSKDEIVAAVDTGLKLVKSAVKEGVKEGVKEALESKDFDRYGPGGVRGRAETLQGTVDCQRAGLFRHPKHCNKFYACRWDCDKKRFTLHVFNCPVHLTFDNNLGACNWPSQGPACVDDTLLPSV